MNLFNNLSHRYGQICIEEVRSWEGKEHKLARYKCHLHFNLRCLSENIVPKGVKLKLKQFQSKTEKEILCKTHRSIINCRVRHCNNIIKDLKSQITQIQDKIKGITSSTDFNNISKQITKTKERVFTTTKNRHIKKFNFLKKTPAYRNTPSTGHHKKEMGHQLIQQATNRWRAVLTTEGTKICTPGCLLSSTLQLLKESVMSLVRTPLEKTVQRSTKKPKRSCSTTKRRNHSLTTSPKRRERPSKPSGKMPLAWS